MSDDYQRIELIKRTARRRDWSAAEKLRIVEEMFASGETISCVARRNGVAANPLWFIISPPLTRSGSLERYTNSTGRSHWMRTTQPSSDQTLCTLPAGLSTTAPVS